MEVYLQIALGFAPVIFITALMFILSRKHRVRKAFVFISAAALCAFTLIARPFPAEDSKEAEEYANAGNPQIVYAALGQDEPEIAGKILDDVRLNIYDAETSLCAARTELLKGDYVASEALYTKAAKAIPEITDEYKNICNITSKQTAYMNAANQNERASAYADFQAAVKTAENNISDILMTIDREEGNYSRAAEFVVFAENTYENYISDGAFDEDEIRRELRRINTFFEENDEFLKDTSVRLARLKLQLLCGDYKGIAAGADKYSDYNELLIISELYLNKLIRTSSFNDTYGRADIEKYQILADRLDEIYSTYYQDKPREERRAVKSQLDAMKAIIKNPVLAQVQTALLNYTDTDYAFDSSKVYLQLAKIAHSMGNEVKTADYIDKSLDTAGDCSDAAYAIPMYEIISVIADKDNPTRLKDVPSYVEQALGNTMTIAMPAATDEYEEEPAEADGLKGDFSTKMQTYVSQKRMSVNIISVDTSGFERDGEIKATITVSGNISGGGNINNSAEELKRLLSVRDCGVNINNFSVDKVKFSGANILLCVDISGSMSGMPIMNLRNAVELFVQTSSELESICLVTFNDGVSGIYPFGTPNEELISVANSLYSGGGTNMYDALIASIEQFEIKSGEISSIILMSDGEDNSPRSLENIETNIGKPCTERGITVYSVGFGTGVNADYLNAFASSTGGAFLYADDPSANGEVNQLEVFFDGLRAQLLNQYSITFKAEDSISYTRELKISVSDGDNTGIGLDSDKVLYYLSGASDSIVESGESDSKIYLSGKVIYGFDTKFLYKSSKSYTIYLLGEGFSDDDSVSLSLTGKYTGMKYDLGVLFADEKRLKVTIPAGLAADIYDVLITINGRTALLDSELSVFAQGDEQTVDLGPYVLTSYSVYDSSTDAGLPGYLNLSAGLDSDSLIRSGEERVDNIIAGYNKNVIDVPLTPFSFHDLVSAVAGLGNEEKESADKTDEIIYIAEDAVKDTAKKETSGNALILSADTLSDLAQEAKSAVQSADKIIADGEIEPIRDTRSGIKVVSEEKSPVITFDKNISDLDIDTVTVETPFASLSANPSAFTETVTATVNERKTGMLGKALSGVLDILLGLWGAIAAVLLAAAWLILTKAARKKISPLFLITACLAVAAANVMTFTALPDSATGVCVDLDKNAPLTLSLPAESEDAEWLAVTDESGKLVASKYNPVTQMVDAKINKGGTYTVVEKRADFTDISDKSAEMQKAVTMLASKGLMDGATESEFSPDDTISRAEFLSVLMKALGLIDLDAKPDFNDVSSSDWYAAVVASAFEEGIAQGYGGGTFGGEDNLPKDQMTVISSNTLITQMRYKIPGDVDNILSQYADRSDIKVWSEDGVALATKSNIVIARSDSKFAPASVMTRGDAAMSLYRIFTKIW